ncbi:SurA N-terminal domain-containing protein [Actimicrobium sp. CCI2.3]|uniref:SurA N-terminal domain-containing protein n=1 Tax=Actimicrobium sp. CCI2.3 TaxID=3048616 RepID=UPI002AB59CC2|nr:SurA N-terminal domain-containing protein [Actimicrobium sp. CCI2.3]MDY7575200.1 SurA N-terminal domain-containing protein [Actimicrobium sp. CCI2.3]MEB0022337.1 SurA N-terminal domain-containing protein [Actimicrobium sp. CCI2.3]
MFEFVRTHKRLMQFLLLLIIVPSFALVGLGSYKSFGDAENVVAKVGGQPITKPEYDAALSEQMARFKQMFGAQFDQKMFDTPEARQGALDSLIAQRALSVEVARQHLSVADKALQQSITSIDGLVGPDGKFDGERYRSLLAMQGMTPAMYEQRLRQDMAAQQLNSAIQSTAFAPKTVTTRLSEISEQERTVQELLFKPADYAAQVKVTPELLKTYYDKNGRQFEVPEQANIEYVVLSSEALAAQIAVTDQEASGLYEQNKNRYGVEEQRRASHILINLKKGGSAADKALAKDKAEKLLAQVRKNPADFARIAKANSEDQGSAPNGGDLDFFGKGAMTPPFEDAVFKLKLNEISNVVESDFGFHIIEVTEIKPASFRTFEQVKPEIIADIKKQKAAKQYSEAAEVFSNTVYEQSDSLKPVADKLKLKVETASAVSRTPNPSTPQSALTNNQKFLNALFADESLKSKHNTEAVEVAPSTLVAGRVVQYKPVGKRPFAEVEAIVREKVIAEESAVLAKKAGETKLAALKLADEATGFGAAKVVSRAKNDALNGAGFDSVMKADVSKLPAIVGTDLAGQGYAVYRISKVAQAEKIDAPRRLGEQKQIANALAQQEMLAYIDALKKKAKVKIIKPVTSTPVVADERQ